MDSKICTCSENVRASWGSRNIDGDLYCEFCSKSYLPHSGPEPSVIQARKSYDTGKTFFEVEFEIGSSQRRNAIMGDVGSYMKQDFSQELQEIEAIGWKLEHVGYYFMITAETSRAKILSYGENYAVTGKTMGVYFFRRSSTIGEKSLGPST